MGEQRESTECRAEMHLGWAVAQRALGYVVYDREAPTRLPTAQRVALGRGGGKPHEQRQARMQQAVLDAHHAAAPQEVARVAAEQSGGTPAPFLTIVSSKSRATGSIPAMRQGDE